MRALLVIGLAVAIAACSVSLDGYSGGAPDAAPPPRASDAGSTQLRGDAAAPDAAADASIPDDYGAAVRADAPSAWFRFDDPVGSKSLHNEVGADVTATQDSGNGPVHVQFGAPGIVSGGSALFDNTGGFDLGDVYDFAGKASFALEAWVEAQPQQEYQAFLGKRNDISPLSGWIVFTDQDSDTFVFQSWKDGNVQVTAASANHVSRVGSHHIVVTQTGGATTDTAMYIDGVRGPTDTTSSSANAPDTAYDLVIGQYWIGRIDEVAIYNHALAVDRIQAHFVAGHRPSE